jgi:actin-like ATPase involved in cell morphogenesis
MAWQLGIDFGTSYTVAAVLEDEQVKVLDIESNGQSRIPSVAFLNTDGDLLVGTSAQHQAVFAPERFEPSPKRVIALGDVFLGDRFVPVADLIAAVLRKVYAEACRQHGETVPAATRVTHPAEWADARLNVLRAAIEAAGLPNAVLIPEPVAAAAWIAMATTPPEHHIAVYDFGGGTFDAAVLRRTAGGFEVAAPPSGRDPLGGEDLDRKIVAHLGTLLAADHGEAWAFLLEPPDASWRRNSRELRNEVQRAKETLSDVLVCQLWVPGIETDVQLTRAELEQLIAGDVAETVAALNEAIEAAGLEANELDGIYLVGGSSRIPMVADAIWRELGVQPAVQDNPKSVVAMGAAAWGTPLRRGGAANGGGGAAGGGTGGTAGAPGSAGSARPGGSGGPGAGGESEFRSHLVLVKGASAEERGSRYDAMFLADDAGGTTVRVRDEPATGRDVVTVAEQSLAVRSAKMAGFVEHGLGAAEVLGRPGGLERRFAATIDGRPVEMLERYLVLDGRALVLATTLAAAEVADRVTLCEATLPAARYFEPRFAMEVPEGWTASERLVLRQAGTGHEVTADHVLSPRPVSADQWRERQVGALLAAVPGATVVARQPARLLNRLEGEQVMVRSTQRRTVLLTSLWLAVAGERDAYEVTVTLREREQAVFAALAAIAMLNPLRAGRPLAAGRS